MKSKERFSKKEILRLLENKNLTEFQIKVLKAVAEIPKGETISYKGLARKIGNPNAYRAVGHALSKNPFPIIIPCHRVIKSSGEIGNYSFGGKVKKQKLLTKEGYKSKNKK